MAYDFNNTVNLPYRGPSNTKVFLGTVWLDDVVSISYNAQHSKEPIWGFRNILFDGVSIGKTLISGQLICNFRYPGYITKVIEQVRSRNEISMLLSKGKVLSTPVDARTYPTTDVKALNAENAQFNIPQLVKDIEKQQAFWWNQNGGAVKPMTPQYEQSAGNLQALKNKKFDLRIVYGRVDDMSNRTFEKLLEDVLIVGEGQEVSMLDGAGDVCLYEVYSFIARNVRGKTS